MQEKRTHHCGSLRAEHAEKEIVLQGWIEKRRDHGNLIFLDVRDREGFVQVVVNPNEEAMATAKDVRNEFVVSIVGQVSLRPDGLKNAKMPTGEIEVQASKFTILSEAQTPPFVISDENVSENLRLKYRYLDLRSQRLQSNLKTRHKVCQLMRQVLNDEDFLEIETPILYKSTPEGARDYLVPSRVHQGSFYALPQSPQTLKQLLMIGGYDRYYQIARCFRDEDLRADRQPEFSQVDIEMSFVDSDDVMQLNENIAKKLWKEMKGVDLPEIPRMTYDEAMSRFGIDRPDLRFGMELSELNDFFVGCGFQVFEDVIARKGHIKGIVAPGVASYSRGQMDKITKMAQNAGAKGLVWIKQKEGKFQSTVGKFFDDEKLKSLFEHLGAKDGDAVFIVADDYMVTNAALSTLRLHFGEELNLIDKSKDAFVWVVDFPMLDYDSEGKRWVACHHPFTSPKDEDLHTLEKQDMDNYGGVKAKAYDLVCNGYEIAGGSIRIHRQEIQKTVFAALGMSEAEVQEKFGFFVEALNYGTPPHGGVAWGLDRLVMILCGTDAIREVIAFPKTTKASCMMSEAPSRVVQDQMIELGIRLAPSVEEGIG